LTSVVCIGDNTVDRYVDQGIMYPGGNAVNVAVQTNRMGHPSAYIGCLARDAAGMLIHDSLVAEGVDVSRCRLLDGQNAFCDIRLIEGDRVFGDYSSGVCDQLALNALDLAFISTFDLTHTSVYSFTEKYLKSIKSNSRFVSYDFSSEWNRKMLADTLPWVDFALLSNLGEDIHDNEKLMKWALAQGPKMILITGGEQGAAVFDGQSVFYQAVTPIDNLVDTLGAGDAFAARFLTDILGDVEIQKALKNAADSAAEVCSYHGAFGRGKRY